MDLKTILLIVCVIALVLFVIMGNALLDLSIKLERYKTLARGDMSKLKVDTLSRKPKPSDIPPFLNVKDLKPLVPEWYSDFCRGIYFKRNSICMLTTNPNRTINVVLVNGEIINTGLEYEKLEQLININPIDIREYEHYGKSKEIHFGDKGAGES